MFWAYMLHCRGGAFYVGHTDNLELRVGQHQTGFIKGLTSDRLPVELVWSQDFPTHYEALTAERKIKGWSRAKKMALIRGDWAEVSRLAKKKDGPSTSSGQTESGETVVPPQTVRAEPVEALSLVCHPATPSHGALSIVVDAMRPVRDKLYVRFVVGGDLSGVALPARTGGGRRDGLWQTTCFEAFVRAGEAKGYLEFNFSPSLDWATYEFEDYRAGMKAAPFEPRYDRIGAVAYAAIDLCLSSELVANDWQVALSAVIEETDGAKSYWALKHPPGPPDFHHPDCFALTLPAPG